MRYFLNDDGGWLSASGDLALFAALPDGYREVTEEQYHQAVGTLTVSLPPSSGPSGT